MNQFNSWTEEMEEFKDKDPRDQEIEYTRSIKAGKRIYYLDVKRNRKGELYLAITESKKVSNGFDENAPVTYEKHKIFLYREDFEKFEDGIADVMSYIRREDPANENHYEYRSERVGNEYKNSFPEDSEKNNSEAEAQSVSKPEEKNSDDNGLEEFKIDEFEK